MNTRSMTTSVAMCTYNGERFLAAQLESILNQSQQLDEIIICDDGSTDSTFNLLQSYAANFPHLIKLYRSNVNLGTTKNFEKAISLCSGDLIFLCDQDDIWVENKVDYCCNFFEHHPQISVLCSNGRGIDDKGNLLDRISVWDMPALLLSAECRVNYFDFIVILGNLATGATMAFRKSLVPHILPLPLHPQLEHDEYIALIAAEKDEFQLVPEKLIYYREHALQQVGGIFSDPEDREKLIEHFCIDPSADRTILFYKSYLQKISIAYTRASELSARNPTTELFQRNLTFLQKRYSQIKQQFRKDFPLVAPFILFSDRLLRKRQLKK